MHFLHVQVYFAKDHHFILLPYALKSARASHTYALIRPHLSDLFLHAFDFILPRLHLPAKLLDLVIQHKLELLQLLVLLLQVIDTLLLQEDVYTLNICLFVSSTLSRSQAREQGYSQHRLPTRQQHTLRCTNVHTYSTTTPAQYTHTPHPPLTLSCMVSSLSCISFLSPSMSVRSEAMAPSLLRTSCRRRWISSFRPSISRCRLST